MKCTDLVTNFRERSTGTREEAYFLLRGVEFHVCERGLPYGLCLGFLRSDRRYVLSLCPARRAACWSLPRLLCPPPDPPHLPQSRLLHGWGRLALKSALPCHVHCAEGSHAPRAVAGLTTPAFLRSPPLPSARPSIRLFRHFGIHWFWSRSIIAIGNIFLLIGELRSSMFINMMDMLDLNFEFPQLCHRIL